nr:MAG TPA: hypothetical protein [Caudoviricetes sp.]
MLPLFLLSLYTILVVLSTHFWKYLHGSLDFYYI